MTLTVSISELRNNLSSYLHQVRQGNQLMVKDGKKKVAIAQITKAYSFDKGAYETALRKSAGVFTAERHPEWRTKKDIIAWLKKTRMANQRTF